MINLLPPSSQKRLTREYLARLLLVSEVALIGIVIISIVAALPSYISASARRSVLEKQKAIAEGSAARATEGNVAESLKKIQALLDRAVEYANPVTPTDHIEALLRARTSGITFSLINYQATSPKQITISVNGIAETRNNLVAFISGLRSIPTFSKVDLPVSDLADADHIPFTLGLTVAPDTSKKP